MNLPTHRMKKKGDLFDAEGGKNKNVFIINKRVIFILVIPLFSLILGVSNEVQT